MEPEPPLVEPEMQDAPDGPSVALWWKILWAILVIATVYPIAWVLGVIAAGILINTVLPLAWRAHENLVTFVVPAIIALPPAWLVIRAGLRLDWPGRKSQLVGWGVGATIVIALVTFGAAAMKMTRDSSKLKSMLPRQPMAGIDQFFFENPNRIFLGYDELFGPERYLRSYHSVDGEDLRAQFPIRQGLGEPLTVRLPDGTTVQRLDVLAVVGKSGLLVTYPFPQGDQFDRSRVYRLDSGESFRDWHIVNRPPDPAGREGRDQDGVHTYQLPGGRRYEVTYRGGVPDGPFRAYQADGTPWGEATYRHGRVVEAWLISRDGRKFDELKNGEAAQKTVKDSLAAASQDTRDSGLKKLAAKDYAGAIPDLSRALAINPLDADLHRARGDAYRATGNLDGAINDWCAAEGYAPAQAADTTVPDRLRDAFIERGRQRQQRGDAAGAAQDFRVAAQTAFWRAEDLLRLRNYSGALAALEPAISLTTVAELHDLRADAERGLQRLPAAETDYTRALELVAAGRMRLPANQRILAAQLHYKRGHIRRWLGRLPDAVEDFRAALPQLGTGSMTDQSDAALWLFIVQCEAGQRETAVRELQATDRKDWWPAGQQTARFLLGEITEAELDAAVTKSNQDGDRLNARLLSGLLRQQTGDEAGALVRFRQAARFTSYDGLAVDAAHREAGQALRTLAEREIAGGNFAAALAALKEALSLYQPAPAGLLALYGDARRGAKDIEGAFATYNEALRAVAPGTEDSLMAGLREKIAALKTEVESIRQARAEEQKAAPAARGQPTPSHELMEAQNRAMKKMNQGDYAGAMVDFNRAIELRPDAFNYQRRADARRKSGDLAGAIADCNILIQLESGQWAHRFFRGQLRRQNHDLPGAAEDFRATLAECIKNDRIRNLASRAAFWLYQTECERGQPTEAAVELAQTFAHMEQAGPGVNSLQAAYYAWDRQVADLLLGRLTEEKLLGNLDQVEARHRDDARYKALYYCAVRRRQAGDQPGALELFRQVVALRLALFYEWETAEARHALSLNPP